jgi:hypothetical protein
MATENRNAPPPQTKRRRRDEARPPRSFRRDLTAPEVDDLDTIEEDLAEAGLEIDESESMDDLDDVTAMPSLDAGGLDSPVPETGLSIDPEDLGAFALVDATQQDNFESFPRDDEAEVGLHVIRADIQIPAA